MNDAVLTERPRITGTLGLPGFRAKAPPPPPTPIAPPKQCVTELIGTFASRWPVAFGEGAIKPLKIGINREIRDALAGEASNRQVSGALKWWVERNSYLTALSQPGARRFGLNGDDAGAVSDDEREFAAQRLKERRKKK
jgi:sRNA-binding protein